jgi:hypothetical protein
MSARLRTLRRGEASLLAATTASQRASHARLVLDLDELAREEWSSLERYGEVRRIPSPEAARRSLFRVKQLLAKKGVDLEVSQHDYALSARFGCRAVRELIELDLRPAMALVERIEGVQEGRELVEPEDQLLLAPETIAVDYRERAKPFSWIAWKHGIGKQRIRRLLAVTGPIPDRALRLCVEERRPRPVADDAIEAAKQGARVSEIATILRCCPRTAKRFLKRHGLYLPPGRPRTSGRPRAW